MDSAIQQSIVDALPYPALILDHHYRIATSNSIAETLFEMPLKGEQFVRAVRHPEAMKCLNDTISTGKSQHCDLVIKLNTPRIYELTCAPLADDDIVLLTLLDVTARQDAQEARSTFVANVSHELRSPLTAVMGIVETLKGPARDDVAARDKFLDLMEAETQRMSRLVGDLLSLAKMESKEHLRPSDRVNVVQVIKGVESSLAASQLNYGGRITLLAADGQSLEHIPDVLADQDELTEVFQNLLENALKYSTPQTPVRVSFSVIKARTPGNPERVVITIEDSGDGIAPEHIPRLTERFYRVDKGRSRNSGGTGLGLAITKHILNRHRARFHIRSEVGTGTKITVSLRA